MPLRAFWAWPLATGLLGVIEMAIQAGRTGFDAAGFALGAFAAAALGLWAGLLSALLATLWRRRRGQGPDRLPWLCARLAVPLSIAVVLTAIAWVVVESASSFASANPIDFRAAGVQIGRGAIVLAIPIIVVVTIPLAARLGDRVESKPWAALLGRAALASLVVFAAVHLCAGPFVLYFGGLLPLGLVVVGALAFATWLPPTIPASRRNVSSAAVAIAVVLVLGAVGWGHRGARSLLLHDARVFPQVHAAATAFLDRDGDGDLSAWLGGGDCDNGDPAIASWRVEIPGNGIDDNCALGDAAPRPAPASSPTPGASPPPVVLITIDTLRADHLAGFGYARDTMPGLERLAASGRWYRSAYAPSNHTFFSVVSLLSGQRPEAMLTSREGADLQAARYTFWLPKRLSELGYRTVAFNPPLVADGSMRPEELRFDRIDIGPYDFAVKNRGTSARQVTDSVERFVRAYDEDAPLFLWIHFYDPHGAHEAHPRFPSTDLQAAYDNELAWVDFHLTRVLELVTQHLGEGVVTVITSDHGEEFGERGAYGHGFSLYEDEIHVPLLIRAPGLSPGTVDEPVSVGSVAPTILELLGQPSEARLSYPSLVEPPLGPVLAESPYFWSERRMEVAIIDGSWKLVWNRMRGTFALFDLSSDPDERTNLATREPARLDELHQRMLDVLEAAPSGT